MQIEQSDAVSTSTTSGTSPATVNQINECYSETKSVPIDMKGSKWGIIKAANRRVLPRQSQGEVKLLNLIDELQKYAVEQRTEIHDNEQISINNFWNCMKICRRRLGHFLQEPTFHYIVIALVTSDLIIVLVDLVLAQLSSPCLSEKEMEEYNTTIQRETCLLEHSTDLIRAELFLFYFSVLLLSLFVIEVFLSFYAFGWKYYKNPLYLIDATIVYASFIMELYFHYGNIGRAGRAASAIIILRLWKIIRAIHAVAHSITLKNRLLIKKIQEAKILLEEEKEQTEQTLEKQEIKLEYLTNILTTVGKLPTKSQMDNYVNKIGYKEKKQMYKRMKRTKRNFSFLFMYIYFILFYFMLITNIIRSHCNMILVILEIYKDTLSEYGNQLKNIGFLRMRPFCLIGEHN